MSVARNDPNHVSDEAFRNRLQDLCRDLEGSTHGGAKHSMAYQSIQDVVAMNPNEAMAILPSMPRSAHAAILTAFSGIGRSVLPIVLRYLGSDHVQPRHDAAMILCIWATRGFLSGADRDAIESARASSPQREQHTEAIIDNALARLRT